MFTSLTNALEVANSYKNKCKIEFFFKWDETIFQDKKVLDETENTVRIPIYTTINTYYLRPSCRVKLNLKNPFIKSFKTSAYR